MPTGGPKDTIPPVVLKSSPSNYSIRFDKNEIEIRFDEYIKLKNLNQELIVSPPMKNMPFITPLNASKTLKIRIEDTLKPNTTYLFNFGNSITDNNEGNVLEQYKYVFSTGDYVDSLKLSGRVRDAVQVRPEPGATIMLYEINETYTDSVIYKEKPTYVTVSKDTTGLFEFSNLKEGKYLLIALKEKNRSYTFNPKEDKIGFSAEPVTVPSDSLFELTLFKEKPKYKLSRPALKAKNHIIFGYEGEADTLEIHPLDSKKEDFTYYKYKEEGKDTINYWFKPSFEADSVLFSVRNGGRIDTLQVRMRELYRDSLTFKPLTSGTLKLKDTFKIKAARPLIASNSEKVQIMNSDSLNVVAEVRINPTNNLAEIWFEKEERQTYRGLLLPGALTDFFGKENDSLHFQIKTKANSEYGTLNLNLENVNRFPVIVQLVDEKYNVEAEAYLKENEPVFFDEINPKKYYLRLIYDDNENGKWDSGNFLERRKPEEIIYYPSKIDVRANWSLNETFILRNREN